VTGVTGILCIGPDLCDMTIGLCGIGAVFVSRIDAGGPVWHDGRWAAVSAAIIGTTPTTELEVPACARSDCASCVGDWVFTSPRQPRSSPWTRPASGRDGVSSRPCPTTLSVQRAGAPVRPTSSSSARRSQVRPGGSGSSSSIPASSSPRTSGQSCTITIGSGRSGRTTRRWPGTTATSRAPRARSSVRRRRSTCPARGRLRWCDRR